MKSREKLLKYLKMRVMVFWGHFLVTEWDWAKFFPKIGKWLIPTIKDKVWTDRKYAIGLISKKSYKKGFVSCDTDTNHSLKLVYLNSQNLT